MKKTRIDGCEFCDAFDYVCDIKINKDFYSICEKCLNHMNKEVYNNQGYYIVKNKNLKDENEA